MMIFNDLSYPVGAQKTLLRALLRGNKLQMELSTNGFSCEGPWGFSIRNVKNGIQTLQHPDTETQTTTEINTRWSCTKKDNVMTIKLRVPGSYADSTEENSVQKRT